MNESVSVGMEVRVRVVRDDCECECDCECENNEFKCVKMNVGASGMSVHGTVSMIVHERAIVNVSV